MSGITNGRWQGRVDEKLEQQAEDISAIRADIASIRRELREGREEFAVRREAEARERKSDWRWRITTSIAVFSAIIAAAWIVRGAL